ncbi:cytochrome [Streptomyces sp. CB02923]|uniref:cytochrome P450 n=1 Tax=Streptomyces sp. CB02923 TaxID=1718985 RepID=UPI00093897FC|nr:cytochrome P450 [Streptomyces sp. CB02923]OKH99076.1 cytochrome [Streptomyces sp. CB02923]
MPDDGRPPRYPFSFRGDQLAPELAESVAHRPIRRVRTNTGTDAWLVTGHEQVRSVLRDRRFSLTLTSDPWMPRQDPLIPPLTVTDIRTHCEDAGLLQELFRGVGPHQQYLTPARVREIATGLLGTFLAGEQPGDLVDGFILPLSRALSMELLGLDPEGCPDNATIFMTFRTGPESQDAVPESWLLAHAWMKGRLAGLRAGGDGLLGRLIALSDASGVLNDEEVADLFVFLLISQFGNPATFLGAASVGLMRHPEVMGRLRADPGLLPQAVDELLRWTVFLGDALPRIAREDVLLDGVLVQEGDLVLVSTDAANQDPRVFPDPHRLDIDRPPGPHLRFSDGRHRCPGGPVARMQAAETLRVLLGRTDDLRLAVPADAIAWHRYYAVTLPVSVPVHWTARGAAAGHLPGAGGT